MISVAMGFHIVAGSIALLSGGVAMTARKGGGWHARAGTWFFGSMLAMAGSGALIAVAKPERGTAVIGVLTCYLVATSWWTARRRDGRAGRFEWAGLGVAAACSATLFAFGIAAIDAANGRIDSLPAKPHFMFGSLALIAALLDIGFIRRGLLTTTQRIGRHLWRMSAALVIASSSFFLGQQDEFPAVIRDSGVQYVPPIAALVAMVAWIFIVRFGRRFGGRKARAAPSPA